MRSATNLGTEFKSCERG